MPVTIRAARADDVSLILQLIGELAEYERLGHEVVATEEDLRDALLASPPHAQVLIAEVGDEAAGYALFFHNFSTFHCRRGLYLEDLFVRPAFRGQGIGKALLARLAQLAIDRRCARLEWAVLDWNESAIDFYRHLGAREMHDWTVYRVSGEALARLAAGTP